MTAVLQPSPSRAAFLVRKYFQEQNLDVSIAMAQEAVARSLGYPNWSTLASTTDVRQAPRTIAGPSKSEEPAARGDVRPLGANYQQDSRGYYSLQRFSLLLLMCGSVRLSSRSAPARIGAVHETVADFARGISLVSKDVSPAEVALTCHPTGDNAPTRLVVTVLDLMRGVPLAANGIQLPSGLELWVVPEEDEAVEGESWDCPAIVKGAGARTSGFATYDAVRDAFTLQETLREAASATQNGTVMVEIRGRLCEVYADPSRPDEWRFTKGDRLSRAGSAPANATGADEMTGHDEPQVGLRQGVRDVRRENLLLLTQAENPPVAARVRLCNMVGCTYGAMLLLLNGSRPMKSHFARDIERVAGLPEGWMDSPQEAVPADALRAIESGRPVSPPLGDVADYVRKAPLDKGGPTSS